MSEANQRCRYYPSCQIHAGEPVSTDGRGGSGRGVFSPANRAEMVELRRAGWMFVEIAEAFDTWPSVVGTIVRQETRS